MKRREFIVFLGGMAIAVPRAAVAETAKIYRLGTLTVGPPIQPRPARKRSSSPG